MKFLLEIDMGNEAMQGPDDLAHALDRTAKRIASGEMALHPHDGDTAKIRDANGNTVGSWRLVAEGD